MINRGFRTVLLSSCLIILLEGCTTTNTGSVTIKYHGEKITNDSYRIQYEWKNPVNILEKSPKELQEELRKTNQRLENLTREKLMPNF